MANDRISQVGLEVVELPDPKARASQVGLEVVLSPSNARARSSQVGLEVVLSPSNARARSSQVGLEAVIRPLPPAGRISQLGLEVVIWQEIPAIALRVVQLFDIIRDLATAQVSQVFDILGNGTLAQRFDISAKTYTTLDQPFSFLAAIASKGLYQIFDLTGSISSSLTQVWDLAGSISSTLAQRFDISSIPADAGGPAGTIGTPTSVQIAAGTWGVSAGTPSGGTFVLTVDAVTLAAMAFPPTTVALRAALLAAGFTTTVTGSGVASDPWIIVFAVAPTVVSINGDGLIQRVIAVPPVWLPIMVFDKAGAYLGSIKAFNVTSPPVRYLRGLRVRNAGAATFSVSRHSPEIALISADRLVAIQSANREEAWYGTMSPRASADGIVEVECRDAFALFEDGVTLEIDEKVSDGTPAAAIVAKILALHNDERARVGEITWGLDSSSSLPFRGNLSVSGATMACLDDVIDRSRIELAWRGSVVSGHLELTLMVRDGFTAGAGCAVFDGPGGNVVAGVQAVDDPTPMVHRIRLIGETTDVAACLPEWAQWAASDITPEVTVEVDPGAHRFREMTMSVDWGLSQAATDAQCNAIIAWLWELYYSFLRGVHDIEGRPWHEGWAYLGPPETMEPMGAGKDALSRRAWRTRLMLVERYPDEPASAVMLSYRLNKVNLREWLIVRYNRVTGVQVVEVAGIPIVKGASLVKWVAAAGSVTLYRVSGGRIVGTKTGGSGTGTYVSPYSVRVWDPAVKRYRNLRQIVNGPDALSWWINPADATNTLTDMGVDAAIDQAAGDGSSLISKVYPFERRAIANWDPRRDGVGALLSRATIFNGAVTTRPRWHIVSFNAGGDATTALVHGLPAASPGTVTTIQVESIFGFPDPDLDADSFPWTGAIEEGLSEEQFIVRSPADMVGTEWTIVRGANGTAAIEHEAGATVRRVVVGAWEGYPWPATVWPEGEEWASAMLADLSKERVDLNAHIVHDGGQLTVGYGSSHAVNVATEGAPSRWIGTGRAIGWSTGDGETELVLEWEG